MKKIERLNQYEKKIKNLKMPKIFIILIVILILDCIWSSISQQSHQSSTSSPSMKQTSGSTEQMSSSTQQLSSSTDSHDVSKKLHDRLVSTAKESETKSCEDYMKDLEKELEAITALNGKCEGLVSRPPKKCDAMLEKRFDSRYFEYTLFGNMETQTPFLPLRLVMKCK